MPKINREEYELLKSLSDNWKWIARDKNGRLYKFQEKPKKVISFQWNDRNQTWLGMSGDRFQFIQWEDEEPYSIAELIEEYETEELRRSYFGPRFPKINGFYNANLATWVRLKESEETEVKTLESIREEIWEEMLRLEDKRKDQWADIKYQTLREVLQKLGHLDEPDTLSQEWIRERIIWNENTEEECVYVDELQNLLVPKQELPVIPKFVADYIDDRKEVGFPIYQAIRIVRENSRFEHSHLREWLWTNKGQETFVRAWLDGYTVEEEPLYRARLKVITDEFIASYLRTQSSDAEDRLKALEIGSKYIHEDYRHLSEFTEDELKRLDIWDSEQWEVEELG